MIRMDSPIETNKTRAAKLELFVRENYCVCGPDGREDPIRLRKVMQAVQHPQSSVQQQLPEVPGVPRLRYRIDKVTEIAEAMRKFLPEVEADPRLHALSFVDPLAVANELGIAVSKIVARTVRRRFIGVLSFDPKSLDPGGRLRGVGSIRWDPQGTAR